ncbi:DNA repair exonuclease [Evansella sp. AB-P1]|uniref:metallophosphoesterase family protein n=1 Tax=Evansella sp. AB-P1 TaxID=3037653 RepID=UPI00241CB52D|nr:DNA repair exonuclease [Evansella sp. AB-P1]MDG5786393.1 DNA repair exonuclease [Evansella sp. AB-P1]
MLRFIHCADIHLGRSIRTHYDMPQQLTEKIKRATYDSFEELVCKAIEKNVDFVLISGDIYDREQRYLRGQWFLKKQAERLNEQKIPLYIIHGNHDPLIDSKDKTTMPDNVHIFKKDVKPIYIENKDHDRIYIYGFSYPSKAFFDNPAPLYQHVGDRDAYHIALLHGQEKTQFGHEPYAPFTVKELVEKDFDYWALGHIHKRQLLHHNPPIIYSGNIQGGNRKETGEKGAYYVELTKSNASLSFFNTASVLWETISISIDNLNTINQLADRIEEEVYKRIDNRVYLFTIHIIGNGVLHDQLIEDNEQQNLLALMRNDIFTTPSVWIDHINVLTSPSIDRERLREQEHLLGDIVRIVDSLKDEKDISSVVNPVFSHPIMKKYITDLEEEEILEIIDQAEKKLLSPLISEVEKL